MSLEFSFHITPYFRAADRLRSSSGGSGNRAQQLHVCSFALWQSRQLLMTWGQRMLPPGKSVSGRCVFGISHLGIHFFHALLLTAWGGPGLLSGLPAPRTSDKEVVWYSGHSVRGNIAQAAHSSASAGRAQGCRAAARQPCHLLRAVCYRTGA